MDKKFCEYAIGCLGRECEVIMQDKKSVKGLFYSQHPEVGDVVVVKLKD